MESHQLRPAEGQSYQAALRIIGAYLDEQQAQYVCILELVDGFAVRFVRPEGGSVYEARHFDHALLHHRRAQMEQKRQAREQVGGLLANREPGYQDVLRAIGCELDRAEAYSITIDELDQGVFVSYVEPDLEEGYVGTKRMALLGPDEIGAVVEEARTRRGLGLEDEPPEGVIKFVSR